MADPTDTRVAVYIDFDNIVISRYNELHGRKRALHGKLRDLAVPNPDPEIAARLTEANVDIGAILDFATSFGNVVISRAYADWSVPVNASYQKQLIGRAIDLTQMFPTVASMKNGADIRLAVDVVEDLFRLPDITHIVIVAGDSDYIALAQRCKRLGRRVVGVGVAGSTSTSLADACDEFKSYDDLPGLDDESEAIELVAIEPVPAPVHTAENKTGSEQAATVSQSSQRAANQLFIRALRLMHDKTDDEWLQSSAVKSQMRRISPSFNEKTLGFASFSAFVKDKKSIAEMREDGLLRYIRLRPSYRATPQQ
jgi:uncharacterized protein (TIGR00288 family)